MLKVNYSIICFDDAAAYRVYVYMLYLLQGGRLTGQSSVKILDYYSIIVPSLVCNKLSPKCTVQQTYKMTLGWFSSQRFSFSVRQLLFCSSSILVHLLSQARKTDQFEVDIGLTHRIIHHNISERIFVVM